MPATLKVSTPEGPSGRLFSSADDYLFRYQEGTDARAAVSLLMPVRLEEYRHRELHPIFQMNLPEGYVLEQLRNRLAKVANVDPMLLLALSGSSAPIGRVLVNSQEVDALLQRRQFPGEKLEEILAWDGTDDILPNWWSATSCGQAYRAYSPRCWFRNIGIRLRSGSPRKPPT
jgi:serine/threonine-protein kinase HipA